MSKNKVVINSRFGGFNLSDAAILRLLQLGSPYARLRTVEELVEWPGGGAVHLDYDIPRHDPLLVKVVEEMGVAANGQSAKLEVLEIEGDKYAIDDYDGQESVDTPNREREWITIG